jgi:glycine betaine/proline transport system substrate-binding protein
MLTMILTLSACSEDENVITFGEGDWDSNAFHDQVVKFIIENGYGAKVNIVTADTAVMVSSMKTEGIDVCMELWSDNVLTYDDDIANGDYVELGINFNDNRQGLYVPRYVVEGENAVAPDLKTVEDLKKYAHIFKDVEEPEKGIIYGGPEGWSATEFIYKKINQYGFNEIFNFKPIDSGAMLAATLSGAYQKKEPWVGYYWEPTWVMGLYDMVLLEDSTYDTEDYKKGIGEFPTVDVTITAIPKFIEENPEIVDFLKNYKTSSTIVSDALAYMQENKVEADEAAIWFLKEKEDMWKSWVNDDVYNKVQTALDKK